MKKVSQTTEIWSDCQVVHQKLLSQAFLASFSVFLRFVLSLKNLLHLILTYFILFRSVIQYIRGVPSSKRKLVFTSRNPIPKLNLSFQSTLLILLNY